MKKLFNDNINLVYKVFNDRIKGKPNAEELKEDLIQIGLLTLWKCCTRFDSQKEASFVTYAYKSIYNNMMCSLTREGKKIAYLVSMNKQVSSEKEDCPITYEDVIASPVNVASEVEIDDLVKQITDELGENADKVIAMIREGHAQVDIAKEMSLSRSVIGNILKKFRKKLKNTLFLED